MSFENWSFPSISIEARFLFRALHCANGKVMSVRVAPIFGATLCRPTLGARLHRRWDAKLRRWSNVELDKQVLTECTVEGTTSLLFWGWPADQLPYHRTGLGATARRSAVKCRGRALPPHEFPRSRTMPTDDAPALIEGRVHLNHFDCIRTNN